jgi:hypothetical protein
MTSTSKEPSGRDRTGDHCLDYDRLGYHRLDNQGAKPDQHERELLERRSAASAEQPSTAGGGADEGSLLADLPLVDLPPSVSAGGDPPPAGVTEPDDNTANAAAPAATRDFIDVGVSDAEDLRRLEESIRWLMSAGTKPMPRGAPLPPVLGLTPLGAHDDDSLLLDPDTLFPPRPRRHANTVASAAKILLVSAIAAPTAYFIASWLQLPGAAATSDSTVVAVSAGPSDRQAARVSLLSDTAPPHAVHDDINVARTSDPAAISRVVMATAGSAPEAATPARLPVVTPPEAVTAPAPAALPAKPAMAPQDIAMMIERGRVLFEAGDVAAARLFFRRAANAGDPAAAIAMGATYDPEILAQRFIRGIEANAEEAQKWYERAREMSQHVEMLAQRH